MDKWTPLAAEKLHVSNSAGKVSSIRHPKSRLIGRLPEDAVVCILQFLPICDIVNVARGSRRFCAVCKDDRVWKQKQAWLNYQGPEVRVNGSPNIAEGHITPTPSRPPMPLTSSIPQATDIGIPASGLEDDGFGEFVTSAPNDSTPQKRASMAGPHMPDPFGLDALISDTPKGSAKIRPLSAPAQRALMDFDEEEDMGASGLQFDSRASAPPIRTALAANTSHKDSVPSAFSSFRAHYLSLLPYFRSLQTHSTSSLLFTSPALTPLYRAYLIATLSRFILPAIAPTRQVATLATVKRNLRSAQDIFEGATLSEFERCDERKDEAGMKKSAEVIYALGQGGASVVQVFMGRREIFYDTRFNPLDNIVRSEGPSGQHRNGVDFRPMGVYMSHVLSTITREGITISKVFPPEGAVLVQFVDRLAVDVLSEYVTTLLSAAQGLENPLFLLATAAVFSQLMRVVPAALESLPSPHPAPLRSPPLLTQLEDVIYRMFEVHMEDYLTEEGDWVKIALEKICDEAEEQQGKVGARFLNAAENPAQVKRKVMASFGKALLLPVTIVPKTVSYSFNAISSVGTGAFNTVVGLASGPAPEGYASGKSLASEVGGPIYDDKVETSWLEDDESPWAGERPRTSRDAVAAGLASEGAGDEGTEAEPPVERPQGPRMQLLLSLDTSVALIAADREALKRVQTFGGYPGQYGRKVRDTMEVIFIVLLQTCLERHVKPAFAEAARQMRAYHADEHENDSAVAPLVSFFELVHVGDTVQQMIQAYFDKEIASYIDRTDFLNAVVREKKLFESALDDAVASGLNAGVDLLMGKVEHLIMTRQEPRDYCPERGADPDLGPTRACRDAIECLRTHCNMLRGSTDKQIMEVFYSEVGIRLHTILCKHLKRAIISIEGGFQVIADLNAYHTFIQTFRQPNLTSYFTALKMVGGLYIIASPKDLGQLARDVHRFEGAFRSEDLYEFIQRRTDWKKIEKAVDREIYGLGKEDCTVC